MQYILVLLSFFGVCVCSVQLNLRKQHVRIGTRKTNISEAIEFMAEIDSKLKKLNHEVAETIWKWETNMTEGNQKLKKEANVEYYSFFKENQKKALKFDWKRFRGKNSTLFRWFRLLIEWPIFLSEDSVEEKRKSSSEIWSVAKLCPYKSRKKSCSMTLEPDIAPIMGSSRDYEELKYYWVAYRNATGRKIRSVFLRELKKLNKSVHALGHPDLGELFRLQYQSHTFQNDLEVVMKQITPFYENLHAFVRKKLIDFYDNKEIKKDGPIPAHILGDMYAQKWARIYDIVNPFKDNAAPNVTEALLQRNMTSLDMFVMAEKFFTSLGMKRMTPYFWRNSMFEKPTDREVTCHAFAEDFSNGKDFRIRMCTEVNDNYLKVIHHEMGHIEYDMYYADLPTMFRDSAHPGFHEAIGDAMVLSTSTPRYLKEKGLLRKNYTFNEDSDISYLLYMALTYVNTIPYAYIIDTWRYGVYNGSTASRDLNKMWWELRLKYQGLCPPAERTEEDLDIAAKFHITNNVEYMRYFVANIMQFQIHKALCIEAGHKGPLFKCNLYKKKKAGKHFANVLKLGRIKHWKKVMSLLTRNKTKKLSVKPLLQYFKPLIKWLKMQNKKESVGWKSDDPMKCP